MLTTINILKIPDYRLLFLDILTKKKVTMPKSGRFYLIKPFFSTMDFFTNKSLLYQETINLQCYRFSSKTSKSLGTMNSTNF